MPGDRREVEAVKAEMLAALNDLREFRGEEPLSRLPEAPFCSFCGKGKDEVNWDDRGTERIHMQRVHLRCATLAPSYAQMMRPAPNSTLVSDVCAAALRAFYNAPQRER